jgi:hypothetical protein
MVRFQRSRFARGANESISTPVELRSVRPSRCLQQSTLRWFAASRREGREERSTQSPDSGQRSLQQLSPDQCLSARADLIPAVSRSARLRSLLIHMGRRLAPCVSSPSSLSPQASRRVTAIASGSAQRRSRMMRTPGPLANDDSRARITSVESVDADIDLADAFFHCPHLSAVWGAHLHAARRGVALVTGSLSCDRI